VKEDGKSNQEMAVMVGKWQIFNNNDSGEFGAKS